MVFKFGAVASLDEVPAEFKAVYNTTANAEGKYEVAESFKAFVASYTGTVAALDQERGKVGNLNKESQTRRQALQAFEGLAQELGITVEGDDLAGAIKAHVTTLTEKVKGGESFKGDLKKIQEAADKRIADLTASHKAEMGAMQTTLNTYLIDNEALANLTTAKAKNPQHVLGMVSAKLKVMKTDDGKYVVRAVDETGNVRYDSAQQPMGVAGVVNEFKTDPANAYLFESTAGSGTGAAPGASKVPAAGGQRKDGELNSTQKISEGLKQLTGGK